MSIHLSVIGNAFQFFNSNGRPLSLGKLYTYAAGTTTPQTTYTDSGGGSSNTNPIQLDSSGRLPNEVWLTDGLAYKFVLQDALGNIIGTYDNLTGIGDPNLAALLAASSGSSLIGYLDSGGTSRTVQSRLRDFVSVKDFGAVGNGSTDDTAAFQAALSSGAGVFVPAGSYKITSSLTMPDFTALFGMGRRLSKIQRAFTGDLFSSMGSYCALEHLQIDGQQGSFGNGIGIKVPGGSSGQVMYAVEMTNFLDPCLQFAADGGSTSRFIACSFFTAGVIGTVGAVKINGTDSGAVPRHFYGCESGGCTLFDFGGCNDLFVYGGFSNGLIFSTVSSKVFLHGMRLGSPHPVTIKGDGHCIVGNNFADGVTIDSAATGIFYGENSAASVTWAPVAATYGSISHPKQLFTSAWTQGSGTQPALGNGTIEVEYSRNGMVVSASFRFVSGSTSTYGNNATSYLFALPFRASQTVVVQSGVLILSDPGTGNTYACSYQISGGTKLMSVAYNGGAVRSDYPFVPTTGTVLQGQIVYHADA